MHRAKQTMNEKEVGQNFVTFYINFFQFSQEKN